MHAPTRIGALRRSLQTLCFAALTIGVARAQVSIAVTVETFRGDDSTLGAIDVAPGTQWTPYTSQVVSHDVFSGSGTSAAAEVISDPFGIPRLVVRCHAWENVAHTGLDGIVKLDVTLTAAVPTLVDLQAEFVSVGGTAVRTGRLHHPAYGAVGMGGGKLRDVYVDAAGTTFEFDVELHVDGTAPMFSLATLTGHFAALPAGAELYGLPCGSANLTYTTRVGTAPVVIGFDPAAQFSVLLIGTQVANIPLNQLVPFPWSCSLRVDDILVSIPVALGPPIGLFAFPFTPPAGTHTMQLLTSTGATVHTSNGLLFDG